MAEKAGKCRKIGGKAKLRIVRAIFAAMMDAFRTVLPVVPARVSLQHTDPVVLMGSCFTEHMGQKLTDLKFRVCQNPFGIIYNPVSLANGWRKLMSVEGKSFDLFEHQGLWHSWEHHGRFSGPDPKQTLAHMQESLQTAAVFSLKAKWLMLTFGTAEVSVLKTSGRIVANNHKMPAALFESRRLSVAEVVDEWAPLLQEWAGRQVVLTVSPVRHLRHGMVDNQRSKATLLLACEELSRQFPHVHYFPAYEILMDDLRDYRFYGTDMIHPAPVAIDYIWQHFAETYLDINTRNLNEQVLKIRSAMQHRPFHPHTPAHQAFLKAQLERISALQQSFPYMDWSEEIASFRKDLIL